MKDNQREAHKEKGLYRCTAGPHSSCRVDMHRPSAMLCSGYIRTCCGDAESKRKAGRRKEAPETQKKRQLKISGNRR